MEKFENKNKDKIFSIQEINNDEEEKVIHVIISKEEPNFDVNVRDEIGDYIENKFNNLIFESKTDSFLNKNGEMEHLFFYQ